MLFNSPFLSLQHIHSCHLKNNSSVWLLGFGVWGSGLVGWGLGVWGLGVGVWDLGVGVLGFGFWVLGLGFEGWGLGFGGWVLEFAVGVWAFGRLELGDGSAIPKLEACLEFWFAALSSLPTDGPGVSAGLGEGCAGLLFGIGCGMRKKGNLFSSSLPKPSMCHQNEGCRKMLRETMAKRKPESRRKTNERT